MSKNNIVEACVHFSPVNIVSEGSVHFSPFSVVSEASVHFSPVSYVDQTASNVSKASLPFLPVGNISKQAVCEHMSPFRAQGGETAGQCSVRSGQGRHNAVETYHVGSWQHL